MAELAVKSAKPQKSGTDKKNPAASKTRQDLSQSLETPVKQILYLQQTVGNRAVNRLIQAKFKVGPPNDIYEKEADRVADKVMKMPHPVSRAPLQRLDEKEDEAQTKPLADTITPVIRRKTEDEEKEAQTKQFIQREAEEKEDEGQAKPLIQREAKEKEEQGQAKPLIQREGEDKEEEGQAKPLIQREAEDKEEQGQAKPLLQRQAGEGSSGQVSSGLENRLSASKGGGQPMSSDTRSFMEPRFGADFSDVRIHTDTSAVQMNKDVNAQAFTTGKDIYFGSGNYNTDTSRGKRLLAHELTHVVQQGSAVQRKKLVNQSSPEVIQRAGSSRSFLGGLVSNLTSGVRNVTGRVRRGIAAGARFLANLKREGIRKLIDFVRTRTRAYPLLTVILSQDPISGRRVRRTPMSLLRGFIQLAPNGQEQLRQMQASGSLQRAANWVNRSIVRLTRNLRQIRGGFLSIWRSLKISDLVRPLATFQRIYNTFAGPVGDIFAFLREVTVMILRFIKDALLRRLKAFARSVRGFPLLTVILGKDPFTGDPVPRTATNFVRGFLSLLDNGEERFRNLQRSGALARAFAWLRNEVVRLDITWDGMVTLFRTAWDSFTLGDLARPLAAFMRIVNLFRAPVGRILRFAAAVGMKILEFVFAGVMGAGGARVLNILKRGRGVFLTIIRDPVAFLGHLIDSVKLGFQQFSRNILRHLQAGLLGWLFGALQGAGLQIPERFDLRGIISLVLQILGLTYERIRPRLVRLLGEPTVAFLERTFSFLRRLVTEGPAAAWEKIVEFAGNLSDRVMEGIRNFVITRVVQAAVMKIATMFNPVGAVIQAILTIYNTVMFFVERINQIMAVVESVINSISNIAAGNITAAANYVEQTMARTIPVIISFLARLLGLGNIAGSIRRVIERIRRPIDRAIDRVVAWIVRQARRFRRGVSSVAGRVAQWWRLRKRFRTSDGETHTLRFTDRGKRKVLMVCSEPKELFKYLDFIESRERKKSAPNRNIISSVISARKLARSIEVKTQRPRRVNIQVLHLGMSALSNVLSRIRTGLGTGDPKLPPAPKYKFTRADGKARIAEVDLLSANRSVGTPPGNAFVKGWNALTQGLTTGGGHWKRMHLINQRFGGLGITENLVPGTAKHNTQTRVNFDNKLNEKIGRLPGKRTKKGVVWIKVWVTYYSGGDFPPDRDVPVGVSVSKSDYARRILFKAGDYIEKPGQPGNWDKKDKAEVRDLLSLDLPDWRLLKTPVFSSASPTDFRNAYKRSCKRNISDETAREIFTRYVVNLIKNPFIATLADGSGTIETRITSQSNLASGLNNLINNPSRRPEIKKKLRKLKRILPLMIAKGNLRF
jgi:hypothetical protein